MFIDFKFIIHVNGILLLILAIILGFVGTLSSSLSGSSGVEFIQSSALTAFVGGLCFFSSRDSENRRIDVRTGYVLTVSSWITLSLFSSLPFYFSDLGISFTDAMFESVSGITTTGATVLTGLDTMPHNILLWRSLLHWMGGIGIIVMAIALFPALKVGGMNLFKSESSDVTGKITPRISQYALYTILIYCVLTILFAVLYQLAGMSVFDAFNHAMSAIATGGFTTHDKSFGFFNSPLIEVITIIGVICGSLPLIMYAHIAFKMGRDFSFRRYNQIGAFFWILFLSAGAVSLWNWQMNGMTFLHAVRVSFFNVTSMMTTTGFVNGDFAAWGSFATGVFFLLYFIGGCAGSTSGSVKIFRWQLLFRGLYNQFLRSLSPHRVVNIRYGGLVVEDRIMHGVRNFLFLYLLTFAMLSLVMTAFGLDFLTSISAAGQGLANAGVGLGEVIGPAGNFANLPGGAKWVLDIAMLLGRLELFTIFVLFIPDFWKP